MLVQFKKIPGTDLEIGSYGRSQSRVIFFRRKDANTPLSVADDARVVLIGQPESRIRHGMRAGAISRGKLAELLEYPMSGSAYHKLRVYTDRYVGGGG